MKKGTRVRVPFMEEYGKIEEIVAGVATVKMDSGKVLVFLLEVLQAVGVVDEILDRVGRWIDTVKKWFNNKI